MYLPVEKLLQETGDITEHILLLPRGMGEDDPTELFVQEGLCAPPLCQYLRPYNVGYSMNVLEGVK